MRLLAQYIRCARTLAALLLLQVAALASPAYSQPVLAQTPEAPKDTEPTVYGHSNGILLAFAAMAVAPASLFLPPRDSDSILTDTTGLGPLDEHVTAYVTGGVTERIRMGRDRYGWAHSGSINVLKNRMYGELRIENYHVPGRAQFQTVRIGYLPFLKAPGAAGVILGYRKARGDRVQNALEVGVPVLARGRKGSALLEPTYLISSAGVTWNYRLEVAFRIPRTPFLAGLGVDVKPVRQGGPYFTSASLLLGIRM